MNIFFSFQSSSFFSLFFLSRELAYLQFLHPPLFLDGIEVVVVVEVQPTRSAFSKMFQYDLSIASENRGPFYVEMPRISGEFSIFNNIKYQFSQWENSFVKNDLNNDSNNFIRFFLKLDVQVVEGSNWPLNTP